jgi:hypothetical protein
MKKSEISLIPEETIEGKILLIRGKKVILDRDLALLYGVKTIRLREQVKRNSERFPEDFTFQLTKDEANMLVSQNAIPSKRSLGGYLPHVFTEHGTLIVRRLEERRRKNNQFDKRIREAEEFLSNGQA